ncbi:MAG TPA: delta-60 repeat domain-containing protein [Rhodanobacteraceae bacterium]|nr:delta-60 repeat domain-containing protein [Rhodanobacteraceae bacterium]
MRSVASIPFFSRFVLGGVALVLASGAVAQSIEPYDPQPMGPLTSLTRQADGKIVIVGNFFQVGAATYTRVARLDVDGSVDTTFADPNVDGEVKAVAVQSDGKLLIGGGFTNVGGQARHYLARLDADGSLDASFVDPDLDGAVWAIAVQPDGKVLAGGDFGHVGTIAQNYFARLGTNGTLDTTFADPELCCLPVRAVALQSDGHVLIGGYFAHVGSETHFNLARYSAAGVFDPSFPNVPSGVPLVALAMLVAPDDSVYVDGASSQPVIRLHADGRYDPTFVAAPTDSGIEGMLLQPNGKVLIGGIFQQAGGQPRHALARLDADGSLDTTFGDLHFSVDAGDPNGYIYGLAGQADGRIVVVGNFTLADGQPRQEIARVATGDYATDAWVVQGSGASLTATWYRDGDGPELTQPAPLLQHSSNGIDFTTVATMTRVAGGWRANASYDVHGATFYLRALGTTADGTGNGSPGAIASAIYSNDTIFGWGFE